MQVISKSGELTKEDIVKWSKNALIFSSPAILVLLADLKDLIPENASWGALVLAMYGLLTDLFKKWVQENRY